MLTTLGSGFRQSEGMTGRNDIKLFFLVLIDTTIGKKNDILIALSTSGNSPNILDVLKMAKKKRIFSVAFLGNSGGKAKNLADLSIIVPSKSTARIQEAHIFLGHIIFEQVEDLLI